MKNRHLLSILFLIVTLTISVSAPILAADYVRKGNKVTCGQVRFDVLSPTVVRMQFAPGGFVDAPTAVVTNRDMVSQDFTVTKKAGWVEIKTPRMSVMYMPGPGKLTSANLRVLWNAGGKIEEWDPGRKDDKNLGGPYATFNDILPQTAEGQALPDFPAGMLSRNGYYLLDDSVTPVWDKNSDWITPRTDKDAQDWYFFLYGTGYEKLYRDYTKLAGKIPMIPRYALGGWVTDLNFEYFGQRIKEDYLFSTVQRFRKENIPLDVFSLDFAWHLYGWDNSLDWSPIISNPKSFLEEMHKGGIKITVNDHPANLSRYDTRAFEAAKKLNLPAPQDSIDESRDWLFQMDPKDVGQKEGWFSTDYNDKDWFKMTEPTNWETAGFNYDGVGWLRKWIDIPENMQNGPVHIGFNGVDDQYDLYVNSKFVAHYGEPNSNSCITDLTDTDITKYVQKGKNLICLRVLDIGGYGGFVKLPIAISNEVVSKVGVSFNLADRDHAKLWMDYHNQLVDQGIDFWWIDGAAARMQGLNSQMWTNKVYYDFQEEHTGRRSFVFSRYGGPGSHRYPGFFTGDCYSNWKVLNCEIPYTLKAGNVLCPYVTHDIGGFIGDLKGQFELYARWVQFGSMSPIMRLHSVTENPVEGNARLPRNYGQEGIDLCRKFFRLRYRLMPYLYTYCRATYDTGLPMMRPLYLEYPNLDQAYRFDEYLLGKEILVAPITNPGKEGVAVRDIYLPRGNWADYFTGKTYSGNQTINYSCPLDNMPIFVKRGSIIPMQPDMDYSTQKPLDPLILDVYTGGSSEFKLYEDDGLSLDYKNGKYAWTSLVLEDGSGHTTVTVGPTKGAFNGQIKKRGYLLNVHCQSRPDAVTIDGIKRVPESWKWDAVKSMATISVEKRSVMKALKVVIAY